MVSFSHNETRCATTEETTSAGQMQGKSDAYWTLILVLMRYLPVLGAASVLPQRWCTPGAFG